MPWKHVVAPTMGLVTALPTTAMQDQMSPAMKGVILKDGEVRSDFGMVGYPVAGALKTNALNGVFMGAWQLILLSGVSYLIALTTTHVYVYNTATTTWDVLTQGSVIDDCEAAWDASANVTSTRDTAVKLRGTYSAKHVIASGFSTGIVSSEDDITTADISAAANTHLAFWVYCDTAIAAEVFSLRLSEAAAGATTGTYADYYIPALVANTWQHVTVAIASPDADDGGSYPDDINALASVALVANSDPGVVTIYLDDIRTAKCYTGDADDRWSVASLYDTMVITNGLDLLGKVYVSGTLTHTDLSLPLPTGAITTCEVVIPFKDHMLYFNTTENGATAPQRCSWSNIGSLTDHVAGTAGFQDLIDDDSWVMGAMALTENEIAIYKERSVIQCTWVGGHTPFRFRTIVLNKGAVNKDSITESNVGHNVVGDSDVYNYNGTSDIVTVNEGIKDYMYGRLDGAYTERLFSFTVDEDNEIQIWFPVAQTTPDEGFTYNQRDKSWYTKIRNISGFGKYKAQSSLTIGDLTGTIGEQNWTFGSQLIKEFSPITLVGNASGKVFKLDPTSLDNDGVAIENEFQTPDFVLPGMAEYENHNMRVAQFIFEAKGQSVTTTYSTDGGATWSPTQGAASNTVALDSIFKNYEQFFETDAKRIRFKFSNILSASGFQLRHYAFYWMLRSRRR